MIFLTEQDWRARKKHHEQRLSSAVDARLQRQSRHEKHPVYDFLFEYYSFQASLLMRWSPGLGVCLQGESARDFLKYKEYVETPNGVMLNPALFPEKRLDSARWILQLLEKTAERSPRFGCFGLHEWAMVYQANELRHNQYPLRFSQGEIDEIVRSQKIVCSHYDAFRFFMPEAVPLNALQPVKKTKHDLEQCGCLHVNMDLYKWAYKFYPWIPSELIADAFLLAVEIREVDMRASPYDLSALGFEPIAIETPEGREVYQRFQKNFYEKAVSIRVRLIDVYRALIELRRQTHAVDAGVVGL